jgi:hypothetical protein
MRLDAVLELMMDRAQVQIVLNIARLPTNAV